MKRNNKMLKRSKHKHAEEKLRNAKENNLMNAKEKQKKLKKNAKWRKKK